MDSHVLMDGEFSLLKKRLMTVFVVTIADMNTRKWNFLLLDYPKLSE